MEESSSMKDRYNNLIKSVDLIKRSIIEKETQKKSLEDDIKDLVDKMSEIGVKPETIQDEYDRLSEKISQKLDLLDTDVEKINSKVEEFSSNGQ